MKRSLILFTVVTLAICLLAGCVGEVKTYIDSGQTIGIGVNIVGAGGVDYFRFKALKAGETQITMVYKRSWEETWIEQKVFTVNIE